MNGDGHPQLIACGLNAALYPAPAVGNGRVTFCLFVTLYK